MQDAGRCPQYGQVYEKYSDNGGLITSRMMPYLSVDFKDLLGSHGLYQQQSSAWTKCKS